MRRIRAVTFDAGGTLIEPWPSVGDVYADVAREFGVECEPEWLNTSFARAWRGRSTFGYTRDEWFELVRQSFGPSHEVSATLFEAIYDRFAESRCWRIYDDVVPALEHLKDLRLPLAVISNWDERLTPLLAGLGLRRYFDGIFVSSELGAYKPSHLIFQHAAAALAVPPQEILHIGDSEAEDVAGAQSAEFQALRIRREGRVQEHDIVSLRDAAVQLFPR